MHGRIFQISIAPIRKDEYINEDSYEDREYSDFADYIADTEEKERKENIRWGFTDQEIFEYRDGHVFYKGIDRKFLKKWSDRIKELADSLSPDNILGFDPKYHLRKIIENPLESAHRFVIWHEGEDWSGCPVNTDEVVEYLYDEQIKGNIRPGDEIHIGGILDYHI